MIVISPICLECRNFNTLDNDKLSCKAYPNGIPKEIINSEHDHTKPFKGDNGIRFEPIKEIKDA